jgi:septal ring factor EnvC (AmiA/AmiB activator)
MNLDSMGTAEVCLLHLHILIKILVLLWFSWFCTVFSNLDLEAECENVQSEISSCEMMFEEVRQAALTNNSDISHLKKQLDKLQLEEAQLSSDVAELSQVLQEEVNDSMMFLVVHAFVNCV